MSDTPFDIGSRLILQEDWTFALQRNGINSRMWEAAGCDAEPGYMAARARFWALVTEKHAILERGAGPKSPVQVPDENCLMITKIFASEPGPGDKKRMRLIDKELNEIWEPSSTSKVTLPAGSSLEIAEIFAIPNSDEVHVKLNVTSTTRPDLLMKKEGGSLSNGKRRFLILGREFETAKYELAQS